MLTDYHTHSYRCGHATGTMAEYIDQSIVRGIGEIGLTDHLYLYWLPEEERSAQWAIAESEYEPHYAEMLELRQHYRERVNVRVSVEADYVAGHENLLRSTLSKFQFDFVLGSVHFMDGWLIDAPEYAHRYKEERVAEIYRRYFVNLQKAMQLGIFDVIAHFDLPKKFGFLPEEDLSALVAQTLDVAATSGVALEVSTAGLRKPIGEIYPSSTILRMMRERDIPIVLSSDAHAPGEIGADYEKSIEAVRAAGYETLSIFERGERRSAAIG